MNTNRIVWPIVLFAVIVYVIIKILLKIQRKYFSSQDFITLSHQTDDIAALNIEIKELENRLRKQLTSDFLPIVDEDKIKSTNDDYVYICNDHIFGLLKSNMCSFLQTYCGFVCSQRTICKLQEMLVIVSMLESKTNQFNLAYEKASALYNEQVPKHIKIISRKRALLLLCLNINQFSTSEILPKYSFKNNENNEQIDIIFNASTLQTITNQLESQIVPNPFPL